MGLAGRKVKQRIGADPRNLTWADDASKFGATYLAKFGWSSSQGLGVSGEGRTSHIKVNQKLDMLGIGAAQSKDPNGIAWKQNRDFENLLKRLNADNDATTDEAAPEHEEEKEEDEKKSKDGRKRKREGGKDERKKKRKTFSNETTQEGKEITRTETPPVPKAGSAPIVPRHRAHRARHIAAKNFASKSASAISEILGVSSTSTSAGATPTGNLTPIPTSIDPDSTLKKLTTSTKSVSDYFKERLLAKTSGIPTPSPPTVASTHKEDAAQGGVGSSHHTSNPDSDEDYIPRGGLGINRTQLHTSDRMTFQTNPSKFTSIVAAFASQDAESKQAEEEGLKLDSVESKKKRENKQRRKEDEIEKVAKEVKKKRKEERRREKEEELLKSVEEERRQMKKEKKEKGSSYSS